MTPHKSVGDFLSAPPHFPEAAEQQKHKENLGVPLICSFIRVALAGVAIQTGTSQNGVPNAQLQKTARNWQELSDQRACRWCFFQPPPPLPLPSSPETGATPPQIATPYLTDVATGRALLGRMAEGVAPQRQIPEIRQLHSACSFGPAAIHLTSLRPLPSTIKCLDCA